ncbi:hypothetical protein LCGC14_2820650, partial [marine sediment metagenome]
FCLPADVEVSTEDGPKSIAEVTTEDRVWSLDGPGSFVLSDVKRSSCTGQDDILHIKTADKAIRANSKHRVLVVLEGTYDYKYLPAGILKIGDTLIACSGSPGTYEKATTKIVSIEQEPAEPVYDLEVEGTHSFVANGVVVHNSNIEQQSIDFTGRSLYYWIRKWEIELNRKMFMPAEQGIYFAEFLMQAFLRGDTAARSAFYREGRMNGWLSVNDIRRLENMNTIGSAGDVYLQPMNMVPLGTAPPDDNEPDTLPDERG